ncbi:MAG: hypothetical protein M3Z23_18080 [Acidobacteriota bacterium]|nr:hypothetical protein [Acidobacteriota bacterium]
MRLSISSVDLAFISSFAALLVLAGLFRRHALPAYLAAVCCAIFAAYADSHNDEVQSAVLVILMGTFALGATFPTHPWRWALIVGLSIAARFAVLRIRGDAAPFNAGGFVALAPAFIGAYAGALLRRTGALVS